MKTDDPSSALREKLLVLTYECPKGRHTPQCPFGVLAGLSHESRKSVIDRMSAADLVHLFDLVSTCSCPADPRGPRV